jgi:proline iminopeptidase
MYESTALAGEPKSHHPLNKTAAEGKVSRDGFDLYYRIFGDKGPLLVVLSGGPGSDPRYMKPVVDEVSAKFRCVLLEQRGTGRSKLGTHDATAINFTAYLEDVEALRKHLGADKLLLLGHSWGGMLALSYGGTYPDRVQAVITLAAGPIAEEHAEAEEENVKRRLLPDERQQIAAWENRKANEPVRAFGEIQRIMVSAYYYDRKKSADTLHYMTRDTNIEVMQLGYDPAFGSLEKFIRVRLPAIKAPVLLVHGRQDAVTEGGIVEAHNLIKGSQLRLINKSGHMIWIEQPDQCWKIVHEFLGSLPK